MKLYEYARNNLENTEFVSVFVDCRKEKMIKVCFLFEGFHGNGGIGRATSIIANRLSNEKGIEVHTISYCEVTTKRMYEISPTLHEHLLFEKRTSMKKAILLAHVIRRVKHIVKDNHIDFLVACGALYYPLGILAVKGTSAQCICVEHTSPETESDYKFQMFCRKIAVKYAHRVVTITDAAKDYYLKTLRIVPDKVCRIYNPVPKEYYQSASYHADSKKIISVGRLSYPKNFSRLIDIAKTVLEKHPDWHWDIFGEGNERAELQAKIDGDGLSERLVLRGQVQNLLQRYEEYAFMVMTSRYEGFPMSLLEAAANRLPMISFDIKTGPNEIIQDGKNGYLLKHEDTQGMIDGINALIESADTRMEMSRKALITAGKFGIESIVSQWKEIFIL